MKKLHFLFAFLLFTSVQVFAENDEFDYYALEDIPSAVSRHNENASADKQITSKRIYENFRKDDPKLPPWTTLTYWYKKEHGTVKGLIKFIRTGKVQPELYSWNEVQDVVARHNENAPAEKQITGERTYEDFRKDNPKLPSWGVLSKWFKEKRGTITGLNEFILTGKIPEPEPLPEPYSLNEVQDVVAKYNENAPESRQITDHRTYADFRHNDPKLPSWSTLSRWYRDEHDGTAKGLTEFIMGKAPEPKPEFYSWNEVQDVVARHNENAPESRQITDHRTYADFRHNDPKLPSWSTLSRWYRDEHDGTAKGLTEFIMGKAPEPELYSLEEIPSVVARHNENASADKQITSKRIYENFRKDDPKLPPWTTLTYWYKKEHGTVKGLIKFIRTGKAQEPPLETCENKMRKP